MHHEAFCDQKWQFHSPCLQPRWNVISSTKCLLSELKMRNVFKQLCIMCSHVRNQHITSGRKPGVNSLDGFRRPRCAFKSRLPSLDAGVTVTCRDVSPSYLAGAPQMSRVGFFCEECCSQPLIFRQPPFFFFCC